MARDPKWIWYMCNQRCTYNSWRSCKGKGWVHTVSSISGKCLLPDKCMPRGMNGECPFGPFPGKPLGWHYMIAEGKYPGKLNYKSSVFPAVLIVYNLRHAWIPPCWSHIYYPVTVYILAHVCLLYYSYACCYHPLQRWTRPMYMQESEIIEDACSAHKQVPGRLYGMYNTSLLCLCM